MSGHDTDWTDIEHLSQIPLTDEHYARVEARMDEVRADAVERWGFVPVCINPDGTPRRREAT